MNCVGNTVGGMLNENIKSFNSYFETTSKPAGFKSAPFFIDWIDSQWDLPTDDMYYNTQIDFDGTIQALGGMYYEPLEEVELHGEEEEIVTDEQRALSYFNALEESARTVWNANNYAFPLNALHEAETEFLSTLRLRIHIAPNTGLQMASGEFLKALGFSENQIGRRGRLKRFFFENPHKDQHTVIVADGPPQRALLDKTGDKINAYLFEKNWASSSVERVMLLGNYRKDDKLERVLNDMLDEISNETNIDVDINFNPVNRKYEFSFPSNNNLEVTLHVSKELANRLGFGPGVTKITKHLKTQAVGEYGSVEDAEGLAKTLVYDTGMVLVTFDSQRSISTMGTSEYFMACLWPTGDGTIVMRPTSTSPAIYLPSSGATQANVIFNIWVYNEDGSTRQIEWKTGLYVAGILQGKF